MKRVSQKSWHNVFTMADTGEPWSRPAGPRVVEDPRWTPGSSHVVSRSALGKQKVYYPRVSAEAEDVRYILRGF